VKLAAHLLIMPNLGICGAISPLFHIPSWLDALFSIGNTDFYD
jgi:hypothetical protein